jgi:hypothetical protein
MNIQLIQGVFTPVDTLELLSQMVQVKIKYQESKIAATGNEEDIKYRESKIKHLQNELFELRNQLTLNGNRLKIDATINISHV